MRPGKLAWGPLFFALLGVLAPLSTARAVDCRSLLSAIWSPNKPTPAGAPGQAHAYEIVDEIGLPSVWVSRTGPQGGSMIYTRTNRGLEGLQKLYPREMLRVEDLKGKRVLDAGTGDGLFVEDLRKQGVDAAGLDIHLNPAQLAKPEIFTQADMAHMPYKNQEFDAIYSSLSVFFYEPRNRPLLGGVLNEFKRVLKVGGVARIGTYYGPYSDIKSLVDGIPGLEVSAHRKAEHGEIVEIRRQR